MVGGGSASLRSACAVSSISAIRDDGPVPRGSKVKRSSIPRRGVLSQRLVLFFLGGVSLLAAVLVLWAHEVPCPRLPRPFCLDPNGAHPLHGSTFGWLSANSRALLLGMAIFGIIALCLGFTTTLVHRLIPADGAQATELARHQLKVRMEGWKFLVYVLLLVVADAAFGGTDPAGGPASPLVGTLAGLVSLGSVSSLFTACTEYVEARGLHDGSS